jgi:hypothetical protein
MKEIISFGILCLFVFESYLLLDIMFLNSSSLILSIFKYPYGFGINLKSDKIILNFLNLIEYSLTGIWLV